ncbi:MAG: 50S ribosomal protein L21 [Planctomyces sp.]|nr:50S ribosomal protein L21 [Planctomyces sp.]MBA4119466.1 50S ribosomal protein L21 [Isosphaera sp.]
MYAIVVEGGGQRAVRQGDVFEADLLEGGQVKPGDVVTLDKVLFIGGDAPKIGQPYLSGASVRLEVLEPVVKGDKLYIQKFRKRKGFRKKTGHRQRYTRVRVVSITG